MNSIVKYVLLSALRDRIYLSVFLSLVAVFAVAIFVGDTMLVEQNQAAVAFIAGASRGVLVFGMILFVCLSIARAFENKEVEFVISKPVSREVFVFSYLVAFLATSFLMLLAIILPLYFIVYSKIGLLIWFLSLFCELLIVISFALLSSLILRNAFLAILASIAFYLMSRMMGFFVMAIDLPESFSQAKSAVMPFILKVLSLIFPRLDLFTQSSWFSYGVEDFSRIKIVFLQSLIYIPLMLFMSFHDIKKKQF